MHRDRIGGRSALTVACLLVVMPSAREAFAQTGACCLGSGSCIETNNAGCKTVGGVFLGAGTTCTGAVCTGACCMAGDTCAESSANACVSGDFQGPGSTCETHCAGPLTTGFTWQGRLKQNGMAVTGLIDVEATLWTTQVGGEVVGGVVTLSEVSVTDGLFTIPLDFGAAAFEGAARWIEFGVRSPHDPSDTQPFATLSPRQPVTATPYALHSRHTRGIIVDDSNNVSIGGGLAVEGVSSFTGSVVVGPFLQVEGNLGATIIARNTATDEGTGAVVGINDSLSGTGVQGVSYGPKGVEGVTLNASGATYGVHGTSFSAEGYGVFSNGNLGASGAKAFRIDHPDDPENKYLVHYATESPEALNFYRGTVMLDSAGEAMVELPAYFAKINKSPSYQLTAVGAPMPMLHVADEIDGAALSTGAATGPSMAAPRCSFRIAGGAPGGKVCWRVEAIRNDLWARGRAMGVEIEKSGIERGKYQHPELYGLPAEMGMGYRPDILEQQRADNSPRSRLGGTSDE